MSSLDTATSKFSHKLGHTNTKHPFPFPVRDSQLALDLSLSQQKKTLSELNGCKSSREAPDTGLSIPLGGELG